MIAVVWKVRSLALCRRSIFSLCRLAKPRAPFRIQREMKKNWKRFSFPSKSIFNRDFLPIHSKSEKVRNRLFSQKKMRKFFGPFWVILGPFSAFLDHSGSYLGHFGPCWVIFGPNCGKFNFFARLFGSRFSLLECKFLPSKKYVYSESTKIT